MLSRNSHLQNGREGADRQKGKQKLGGGRNSLEPRGSIDWVMMLLVDQEYVSVWWWVGVT